MISRFDHITVGVAIERLEDIVSYFRQAGFAEHERRVCYPDGRVSAFVVVSGGYIEFTTAVGTFTATSAGRHSLSISAVTDDIEFTRRRLGLASTSMPDVELLCPSGESVPAWAILSLPEHITPGTKLSVIKYLRGAGRQVALRQGENKIFGLCGFSFNSEAPSSVAERWYTSLGPALRDCSKTDDQIRIGEQFLRWHRGSGLLQPKSEVAITMYSLSLATSREMMLAAGFLAEQACEDEFVVRLPLLPQISFVVRQASSVDVFLDFLLNRSNSSWRPS
jgi:hypothetical protein